MRPITGFTARLGGVIALHLALLAALLTYGPAREAMVKIIPVTINMANAPPAEQPAPRTKSEAKPAAKPEQRPKAAPTPSPIISAPTDQAASTAAPPAPASTSAPANTASPALPAASAPAATAPAAATGPLIRARVQGNPKPEYPAASRQLGEEGRVVLNVRVSASGTVEQVSIQTSSGHPRLDQAALKAVKAWKFIPASRGGETVADSVTQPVNFSLEDN